MICTCKCSQQAPDRQRIEALERRIDKIEELVLGDILMLQRIRHGIIPIHKPGDDPVGVA